MIVCAMSLERIRHSWWVCTSTWNLLPSCWLSGILSPVHTSNIVEATGNFVESPSPPAKMSKQHCRMLQVERFFRHCRMLLRHCRFRQQCRTKFRPFDKVETKYWTCSICFDFVERTKFYNSLVRHCGNKVECCFDNVACCFDIVAGVDGALILDSRQNVEIIRREVGRLCKVKAPNKTRANELPWCCLQFFVLATCHVW